MGLFASAGEPPKAGTAIAQAAATKTRANTFIIVLLEVLCPKMIFDPTTWHGSTPGRLIGCIETRNERARQKHSPSFSGARDARSLTAERNNPSLIRVENDSGFHSRLKVSDSIRTRRRDPFTLAV
jgi:hypothetical protein